MRWRDAWSIWGNDSSAATPKELIDAADPVTEIDNYSKQG